MSTAPYILIDPTTQNINSCIMILVVHYFPLVRPSRAGHFHCMEDEALPEVMVNAIPGPGGSSAKFAVSSLSPNVSLLLRM